MPRKCKINFRNLYSRLFEQLASPRTTISVRKQWDIFCHDQDKKESFGTILANTQIPPSLLRESLINLKKYACPAGKKQAFYALKQLFVLTQRVVFTPCLLHVMFLHLDFCQEFRHSVKTSSSPSSWELRWTTKKAAQAEEERSGCKIGWGSSLAIILTGCSYEPG